MENLNWNVPHPDVSDIAGMPIYWRYRWGVDEKGIHAEAFQLIAVKETEYYAWVAPAYWFDQKTLSAYGIADPKEYARHIYEEWKKKRNRYAVKKVKRSAIRSYAYESKADAFSSLLQKQRYRLKCLRRDLAVCESLVSGLNKTIKGDELYALNRLDFGHNTETESWVFI